MELLSLENPVDFYRGELVKIVTENNTVFSPNGYQFITPTDVAGLATAYLSGTDLDGFVDELIHEKMIDFNNGKSPLVNHGLSIQSIMNEAFHFLEFMYSSNAVNLAFQSLRTQYAQGEFFEIEQITIMPGDAGYIIWSVYVI